MGLRYVSLVVVAGMAVFFQTAGADTRTAAPDMTEAPVRSASLFKNGLALITRELLVPSMKESVIVDADPLPLHGTFWVDFEAPVAVRGSQAVWKQTQRVRGETLGLGKALRAAAGKKVTLLLQGGDRLTGVIISPLETDTDFLTLRTDKGCELLDVRQVIRALFEEKSLKLVPPESVTEVEVKKSVLVFSFSQAQRKRVLRFTYLCRGASWAPAYHLDLRGENQGVLSFQGVVKNELLPFRQTRVNLVSGFPAILYERVVSPLSPSLKLDAFLASLNHPGASRNAAVTQQVALNVVGAWDDSGFPEVNPDPDSDIHLRPVGPLDLDAGAALMLELGKGEVPCERVVEWTVPESRDPKGRYQSNWRRQESGGSPDELWDTLIVPNPFDFPMTTAPFTVWREGQILSQNLSYWTARGQKSRVRSGRALNIGTEVSEEEVEGSRKRVVLHGDDFMQTDIRCEISLANRRGVAETLMVNRFVWGKIIDSAGEAEIRKLAEGARSINPRSEIEWKLKLARGEKTKIAFTYRVLTDI